MDAEVELLNFVYQNSQMGVDTINQLVGITNEENFKTHLTAQLNEYAQINSSAKTMLQQKGHDEKGLSKLTQIKTYLMINLQTLKDKSSTNLAEMMIIGSTMGMVDAIKNIHKYRSVDSTTLQLMEKLQKFEENNIERLKVFL